MVRRLKIVGIVQCRMSSSRLPAKAMLDLSGKTILERVLHRANKSNFLEEIWVATSTDKLDDIVEFQAKKEHYNVFRGNLDNVLCRFCKCIEKCNADIIVRITADNPFTEVKFIDLSIAHILNTGCDYVTFKNVPYGSGVESFTREAIFRANKSAISKEEKEHVTLHILNNMDKFNCTKMNPPWDDLKRPDIRATIDTIEDYYNIKSFYNNEKSDSDSLEDYIKFIDMRKRT
jgi:spore coat polysaccharide biosynthesis protein SpsF